MAECDKFFGGDNTVEARAFDFDDVDIRDFSEALLEARDDVYFGDELEVREDEVSAVDCGFACSLMLTPRSLKAEKSIRTTFTSVL